MRAHEESGVLLLLLMMLCVTKTSYHIVGVRKLTEPRAAAFLHLLESLLIMEQWMKQDTFEVKSLPAIKRHLRRVMQLFSSVVDRQEGNGDCTVKFHLPMHLINDIKKYRAPANWDEGIGEHNHIANAKGPAKLNTNPVILNTKPLFATRRTWHMAVRLTNIKPNMNKGGTSSILEVRCYGTSQMPLQTFGLIMATTRT